MDLHVIILDENGDERGRANIYKDGSDSEGANRILELIEDEYGEHLVASVSGPVSQAYENVCRSIEHD